MADKAIFKECSHQTMNITVDDGRVLECDILTIMRLKGRDYVVLMPKEDQEQVFVYGFGINESGDPDLRSLTEDSELQPVLSALDEWFEQSDDRIPVDVFSGFLGSGKTTLIKKLLKETYAGQQVVLIENEFGVENIDAGFLQESGVEIKEISAGCICCSMVGDFTTALKDIVSRFKPDRILIEPSGVGKLSDVIKAVSNAEPELIYLDRAIAVVDATKCSIYMKNFGEFYSDQVESAMGIVLSRTDHIKEAKLSECMEELREYNKTSPIITTPWAEIHGDQIFDAIAGDDELNLDMDAVIHEHEHEHEHHHDHEHCHDEHCDCHEHHHHDHEHCHDEHCDCHEHHHHDHEHCHDEHCDCHEHHHHDHEHCHDEHCDCHEHHHHDHEHCHDEHCSCHHHGHHHAEDVFSSWGGETVSQYSAEELEDAMRALDSGKYGQVLRAKGIVKSAEGGWWHFDYVPECADIRHGAAATIGKLCVIGAGLDEAALGNLFKR